MKVCKICRIEYDDNVDVCPKCGTKLETKEGEWITPQNYELGY